MGWPGEDLLIKLWDTLFDKGIGGLIKPFQIRREGEAHTDVRAREVLVLAQAEKLAEDIRTGKIQPSFCAGLPSLLPTTKPVEQQEGPPESTTERHPEVVAAAALESDAIRREVNVAKAVLKAEETLREETSDASDKDVDEDWLYRWRDYSGSVSSEDLQHMWGRVLAGEITSPGSISIRTMELLRNLSTDEAKEISHVFSFVIGGFLIKSKLNLINAGNRYVAALLRMQELGVIQGLDTSGTSFQESGLSVELPSLAPDSYLNILPSNGRVILVVDSDPAKVLRMAVVPLTSLGRQILTIGDFEPNEPLLIAVGEEIKSKGFDVRIASYDRRQSNKPISWFDERQL